MKVQFFFNKIFLLFVNILINNHIILSLIGLINKKYKKINTLFIAYPASKEYNNYYIFHFVEPLFKFHPYIIGVFNQNNRFGMMTGISIQEDYFIDNIPNLQRIANEAEKIRRTINTKQKTFAGILPGLLFYQRIIKEKNELEVSVKCILAAINLCTTSEKVKLNKFKIVLLGGKGFVGREINKKLIKYKPIVIDKDDEWPVNINFFPIFLLNTSRKSVLKEYIINIPNNSIILNEVYPEPSKDELNLLKMKGIAVYHIVGVKAKVFPNFPSAYNGGIPCCAAINDDNIDVLIKKLI